MINNILLGILFSVITFSSCTHDAASETEQPGDVVASAPEAKSQPAEGLGKEEPAKPSPQEGSLAAEGSSSPSKQPQKDSVVPEEPPKLALAKDAPQKQLLAAAPSEEPLKVAAPKPPEDKPPLGLVKPGNPHCQLVKAPQKSRSETYANLPFKSGEVAKYELDYGAIHVGYGFMRVNAPIKYSIVTSYDPAGQPVKESLWHMQFSGHAYTGDWYSGIYSGNDKVLAYSRPWDFGVSKFYVEERAKTLLSSVHKKKYLDFEQGGCEVKTREEDLEKKKEKKGAFELTFGAVDALGAFYKLRTLDYSKGPVKFIVYSSEKNWLLEATPRGVDEIKVPAGTFQADRLTMRTFLGEKLEQRGELTVWVAKEHPNRPLVKIAGEFKFGDITLDLAEYKPGR